MADASDVGGLFSTTAQSYGTIAASFVLGLITLLGWRSKMKTDSASASPADAREIVDLLSRLLEVSASTAQNCKTIAELIAARARQEDIDRAYQRGRDDVADAKTKHGTP